MTRLSWGSFKDRKFEAGVDRVVFYPQEGPGVPWDGVVSLKEDPVNSDIPKGHVDGVPYRSQKTKEGFALLLQAYTCPKEFDSYELTSRGISRPRRNEFGLAYRTKIGNANDGLDHGYKIHLVYNALAMPSSVDFQSLSSGGLNAAPFSWDISTKPTEIPGAKPAAHLIIDTTLAYPEAIQSVEDILYGSNVTEARLPEPLELLDVFEQHAILTIIDHGDGTWTAIGPDDAVKMIGPDTFQITWPSVVYLDEDTYQVSSL